MASSIVPAGLLTSDGYQGQISSYLNATLPALYSDEQTREYLEDIYGLFGAVRIVLQNRRKDLNTLLDPDEIEDEFIDHLGTVVGFDRNVGWFFDLPNDAKRRLISYGALIWKNKGTSYREIMRAVTGGRVWIAEWDDVRWLVGGTLPPFGTYTPFGATSPERQAYIHYTNPNALATSTILTAGGDFSPMKESAYVWEAIWLDDFTEGMGQLVTTPTLVTIPTDGQLVFQGSAVSGASAWSTDDLSALSEYTLHVRGNYTTGDVVSFISYYDVSVAGFGYVIEVTPAGAASTIVLRDGAGGAVLQTSVPFVIDPAFIYSLRIQMFDLVGGDVQIIVTFEGTDYINYTDVAPASFTSGGWFANVGVNDTFTARLIEILPH